MSTSVDTLIDTIAVRLRGNTSLYAPKKSFKIDLNAFIAGQKYADLEKLNVNANQNDLSASSRPQLEHLRRMGLDRIEDQPRALEINGDYMGAYLNTEHMDEEFVEEYYDKDDGNFYKCLWPATLEYISQEPDDYKFEVNGRRAYELKTNERSMTTPTSRSSLTCSTTRPMPTSSARWKRCSMLPIS